METGGGSSDRTHIPTQSHTPHPMPPHTYLPAGGARPREPPGRKRGAAGARWCSCWGGGSRARRGAWRCAAQSRSRRARAWRSRCAVGVWFHGVDFVSSLTLHSTKLNVYIRHHTPNTNSPPADTAAAPPPPTKTGRRPSPARPRPLHSSPTRCPARPRGPRRRRGCFGWSERWGLGSATHMHTIACPTHPLTGGGRRRRRPPCVPPRRAAS